MSHFPDPCDCSATVFQAQKALERGNSVPGPKVFCEGDQVKLLAVLLHNTKFTCDLHVINRSGVTGAVLPKLCH